MIEHAKTNGSTRHKARRCIVHFGLAKTGTSAIQAFFHANRKTLLAEYGILYPGEEVQHWHLESQFSANPHNLIQVQRSLANGGSLDFILETAHGIERELATTDAAQIVLSSEYLVNLRPSELRALNAFVHTLANEVISLVYVRDPWSFSTSYAQELVRNGYARGAFDFGYCESNVEFLDKIAEHFSSAMIVRPYLGGTDFDSVTDICALLGVDRSRLLLDSSDVPVNEGLNFQAACLLSHFNDLWPQFDGDGQYLFDGARDWCVEAILKVTDKREALTVSRRCAERILRRAWSDLDAIHDRYLDGNEVFLRHFEKTRWPATDDMISVERLERREIARLLIEAMREISARARENMIWAKHAEAEAAHHRGVLLLERGEYDSAKVHFQRVLEFRPGDAFALQQIESLSTKTDIFPVKADVEIVSYPETYSNDG